MLFFSSSARVPKTAWILLPTSTTPAAPRLRSTAFVDLRARTSAAAELARHVRRRIELLACDVAGAAELQYEVLDAEGAIGLRSEAVGKPMLMLLPPERTNEELEILARIAAQRLGQSAVP